MNERAKLELLLPDLNLYLEKEFGSKNPDHRIKIREAILNLCLDENQVLNLAEVPRLKHHCVSISHTQQIGGFALNPGPVAIGFDIELTARVKESHLERLSRYQDEAKHAPGPNYLWTAKEAVFKAMAGLLSLRVLSDFTIENWKQLDHEIWRYDADAFYGVSYIEGEFTLSIARARGPNTSV